MLRGQSGVNMTTWHQDIPEICTGCVYRTGQNLKESTTSYLTMSKSSFGQYCSFVVDGEILSQPLVVTNVAYHGQSGPRTIVYVVTMNDSVYAFDGTPSAPTSWPVPNCTQLDHLNLLTKLGTGEVPPLCNALGGRTCTTMAPDVGVLGTPVITANTSGNTTVGSLYLVAESVNNSNSTFYHRLWTLDITNLQTASNYVINPTSCSNEQGSFSQKHIQRPALLLGGDNYLYVAFSMMDGTSPPLPNGIMLAYNASNLAAAPLCLALSQGTTNNDGAGIWAGGGGPAFGPDANTPTNGKYYTFFNTGNGQFGGKQQLWR